MENRINTLKTSRILLPNLICEMLTLCTSEDRRNLYKELAGISNRGSLGAIFKALCNGSESVEEKRSAARITAALSIPARIVVNGLLSKR